MNFADRMSNSGFVLLAPEHNPGGDILLGERTAWDEDLGAVVEVMWAIRRGKEDMGRTLMIKHDVPHTIRRAAAIKDAETFIADNIDVGRFPAN